MDRENWLRNDLHDPYSVLPSTLGCAPGPLRPATPREGAYAAGETDKGDLECTTGDMHEVQEWQLEAVHGREDSGDDMHGTHARNLIAVTAQAKGGGGKLITFRQQQTRAVGAVVELPKQRLAYRAGSLAARCGFGDAIKSKGWRFGQPKKVADKLDMHSSSNSPADTAAGGIAAATKAPGAIELSRRADRKDAEVGMSSGELGVGRWRKSQERNASKYHREDPPPLAIEVPDFDSEQGFTHGFYDPDSYTMYIM